MKTNPFRQAFFKLNTRKPNCEVKADPFILFHSSFIEQFNNVPIAINLHLFHNIYF